MLEPWGMLSTPLLPSHPDPFWPGVVAPDKVLSIGQIELFDIYTECKQMTCAKLNCQINDQAVYVYLQNVFINHIQYICKNRIWL